MVGAFGLAMPLFLSCWGLGGSVLPWSVPPFPARGCAGEEWTKVVPRPISEFVVLSAG